MNIDVKMKMNAYLRTVGHTTPAERGQLRAWIKSAETAYGNPWGLAGDDGSDMDFISALRVVNAMQSAPDIFAADDLWLSLPDEDQDLPF